MDRLTVRRAGLGDLLYIDSLRRCESERIGFLPLAAYKRVLDQTRPAQRIWLAEIEREPIGFLYATAGPYAVHVQQIAVQQDARRHEYGTALVAAAENYACQIQRAGITLRVATELEATNFWDALGYRLTGMEPGGHRRGRIPERRHKALTGGLWTG